jgi:Peptidase family S58
VRISFQGHCGIAVVLLICVVAGAQSEGTAKRPRSADIGLKVGILPTGPLDAITDVAGVEVGQTTIVRGDNVRTGVTAILPHAGNLYEDRVPGGIFVGNGYGKLTGFTQVDEMGEIETPTPDFDHQCAACGRRSDQLHAFASGECERAFDQRDRRRDE